MNATEARARIKTLGEFVDVTDRDDGSVILTFLHYEPGARSGKFHSYKYLAVPVAVYEEIKHELK